MKSRTLALAAILALSIAPALWAQGRGGGQGRGGQQEGRPQSGQQRGGQQGQRGEHPRTHEHQRKRMHTTEQQRRQYHTCTRSAERVRTQAREMAQAARGGGFNKQEFRQQHQQLQNAIQNMQEEHNRFVQGLTEEQKGDMQERIRKMEQSRERVREHLQQMDQELEQDNPNRKHIAEHAREMEKAVKEWQKQYRHMGSDMGIKAEEEETQ